MVELQQLKQLITVRECGSISAAARALHISQPALSRSIQRLEEALSVTLLDHGQNRVSINPVGELAVEKARSILREVEELPLVLNEYAHRLTTISIGACAPAPMWNLAAELVELFPDNAVNSEMKPREELTDGLLAGRYHLIVTDQPVRLEGVLCRTFAREQLLLSVPPEHPLSGRESLRLVDLTGLTMLLYQNLGIWNRVIRQLEGQDVRFIVQTDREVFGELVRSSDIPCFGSNMIRHLLPYGHRRVDVPLLDEEARVTYYLCAAPGQRELMDRIAAPEPEETE